LASRKEQRDEARRQREEREQAELAKQRRKRRLWQVSSTLVVAVVIIVIAIAVSSSGGNDTKVTPAEGKTTSSLFTGIAQNGITLGNQQAKVTVYEFADLQCPFCREYTVGQGGNDPNAVFPQLVDKYVKPGKVKMVWRNLTFIGPDSVTAARAAGAAGLQNKLWDFVDLFYKNQGTENTGYVTDKFLEDIGSQISGFDVNKMKADESSPTVEQQLGEAQNLAQQFGINSTPSFLIQVGNGKPQKLNYKQFTLSDFSGPIDQALKQAGQ
jgi:protein-disulfide isomerase